ncbi:MAG TPA: ABC transporter permease [Planctomycetota bacterium]|nr:ABC transporter permease [Planctomycetota bacterium]
MSAPERRRGLALNLHAIYARAYVRIVGVNRELSWVLYDTLLPMVSSVAYVFIYRALGAPPRFEAFAVLGMAMATYWFHVLWGMAAQFYWEKDMGNLELYLQAPMSRMSILAGMALGSMFSATVRFATILAAGVLLFGIRFDVPSWGALAGVFALTLVALDGLGMTAASLFFVYGRGVHQVMGLLQEPVFLAAGFFFPVRPFIGRWALLVGSIVPLTFGLDAIRQCTLALAPGEALLSVGAEAAALAVMSAAFLATSHFALAHMETLAKRDGTLTLKWQ